MSIKRSTIVSIAILSSAVILLLVALSTTASQEIALIETVEFVPADHEPGVAAVVSKTELAGSHLFGIQLRKPERLVHVVFTAPGDCLDALQANDAWPPVDSQCAGSDQIDGDLGGLGRASAGRTSDGQTLINVAMHVDESCYNAVRLGIEWSEAPDACG